MNQPIVQVDAFTDVAFRGNPAAVCVLEAARNDAWMQAIAAEMNLSETAFVVPMDDGSFGLRWFTPKVEVALCGHATLASAHVLWETDRLERDRPARFATKSGVLTAVMGEDGLIELDFPALPPEPADPPPDLLAALGGAHGPVPAEVVARSRFDYLVQVADAATVRTLAPDHHALAALDVRGVMVTARDHGDYDFISRFFAPGSGIAEDPVTGSAHCTLGPHWASRLGRTKLLAYQASPRGGVVRIEVRGDRVALAGRAVTVFRGELLV